MDLAQQLAEALAIIKQQEAIIDFLDKQLAASNQELEIASRWLMENATERTRKLRKSEVSVGA